ncbi:YgaP-like transmembrane domain [Hydrogenophaga pseudoflava]|jgi:hypothetical protein|uniref:YgaP-like transmembrane domain n=1 Tax=Hydrogenophaga pseudoflava TaxID=47421 RepID=UPI000824B552|nr:YgaP-like transmembrane domain [Hydrogenophaga pseudoflava]
MYSLTGADRAYRLLSGAAILLVAVFSLTGLLQVLTYASAGLVLTTAIINACPLVELQVRSAS